MQRDVMALKRAIGRKTLFLLSINAILGTGVFFLPAVGMAVAGPASIFSWLLMAVVAVLMSCYFAELVSLFPTSGGVYAYVKRAFGPFPAFVTGWIAWIVANITIAMLVVGSLYYLFPHGSAAFYTAASVALIGAFTYISYRGIAFSATMLVCFGLVTVASLLFVAVPGIFRIDAANFSGAFPFHVPAVLLATYFIAETFFGWETITFLSEEVRDARKTMPRVMVWSTIAIAALSLLLALVAIGVSDERFLTSHAPLSELVAGMFGAGVAQFYTFVVFLPLIGTAAGWIVSSPRLLFAMARDRALVRSFTAVHPQYHTPHRAILFQAAVSMAITVFALGSYAMLLSLLVPLVMVLYSITLLCVPKLRKTMPKAKRSFTAPFASWGPVAIGLFNAYLVYTWALHDSSSVQLLLAGAFFILLGVPMYLLIKLQTDSRFVARFYDGISFLWDRSFRVWYSDREAKRVIGRLALKNNVAVLDFGCGSGITTLALSRKLGRRGTIVAVDISEQQLKKTFLKLEKAKEIANVIVLKADDLRFPPRSFDAITAVDVLEHLEDPEAAVKKLMQLLKKGGTFSFLSFGRSFGIPAAPHLGSAQELRELFARAGVRAHVRAEKKKMTEYYYVWGRK